MANRPLRTTQDFLDALEQDPQLKREVQRHILTEALLDLPALVGQPEEEDETIVQQLKRTDSRLEALDDRTERMDSRLEALDDRTERMDSRLGNVAGDQYELRLARRAISRVRPLRIERARIAFAPGESHPSFHDAMHQAVEEGLITQEELDDLTDTDVVLHGENNRHAVIEASLRPDRDDLERAARRAGVLARATGEEAIPVVAAPEMAPDLAIQAEEKGVRFIRVDR